MNIFGTSSTTAVLGSNDTTFSLSVTSGINGPVLVDNVGVLNIEDGGNVTTKENVKVTESTITGTGLFGLNGSVQYRSNIPGQLTPAIFTGQLANTYTVTTSGPFSSYNAQGRFVLIEDNSTTAGLNIQVDVTAFSDMDLSVVSKDPAASSLLISAPPGTGFNPFRMTSPNGFEQVLSAGPRPIPRTCSTPALTTPVIPDHHSISAEVRHQVTAHPDLARTTRHPVHRVRLDLAPFAPGSSAAQASGSYQPRSKTKGAKCPCSGP